MAESVFPLSHKPKKSELPKDPKIEHHSPNNLNLDPKHDNNLKPKYGNNVSHKKNEKTS